ncbi:MAG: PD-(D/E)XK nuclease family protein, partial [Fidelibacterota bacterium]
VMLRNYCKDPMNRECEVLLNEAPFKLTLKTDKTGYLFEGKIDQLRKYPDGTLDLTDFKTGKGAIPSDVQLRRDIQLNGYSLAIQDGFFAVDGISQYIGQLPDTITYHNLRDYMEYKKPTPIALLEDRGNNLTSSYREWFTNTAQTYTMDEIRELTGNNRLSAKTKVYFNTGHCKGPARHTVPITEHSVEVIKKQIQRYCAQIRFDFWPMDDRACNSCRHVDACDIYLDGTDKNFVAEDDFLPEEYYQLN